MSNFSRLLSRYRQFGGIRLIHEYAKIGLFWIIFKEFCICILKRRSFKTIYPVIGQKVTLLLREKYGPIMLESMQKRHQQVASGDLLQYNSTIIWFCWLQGQKKMPPIVQACYYSIKKYYPERLFRFIDCMNYKEYIDLPDYIEQKWNKGRIPAAMFADIIRLELLTKYGGTWIDSAVLVTGHIPDEYMNANLIMPQYTRLGSLAFEGISNWFITSLTNNEVLLTIRDMIYAYWKDYDCVIWYYIFHLFFQMIAEQWPDVVSFMPYAYSPRSLVLMHHWSEPYNKEKWQKVTQQVTVHKLSCRPSAKTIADKNNYYNAILKIYAN